MREHPILFKGELVRAILAGKKTQTRRLVTLSTSAIHGVESGVRDTWKRLQWSGAEPWRMQPTGGPPVPLWRVPDLDPEPGTEDAMWHVLPRVRVGDRLWVRETWRPINTWRGDSIVEVEWKATGSRMSWENSDGRAWMDQAKIVDDRWRPGIHMPRWACRLELEVTAVRAERLQDISIMDIHYEGCGGEMIGQMAQEHGLATPVWPVQQWAFARLWDRINGKRPGAAWADNPALWVLEWRPVAATR